MGRERITRKMLDLKCCQINKALKCPITYSSEIDGIRQTNIGNYHIDCAYGGFALYQTMNEMGGVHAVFSCGHVPARDLFNRMQAFLDGVRAAGEMAIAIAKEGVTA